MMARLYCMNFGLSAAAFVAACLEKEPAIAWIAFFNAIISLQIATAISKAERDIK